MAAKPDHVVFVVDDDESFRRSTVRLLRTAGYNVESFSSAREFFERSQPDVPACLVTDLRMPGMNGLEFQRELASAGWQIPVIFVTGHGDVRASVRAMKAGAVEFLLKPFQDRELFDAIESAIAGDVATRHEKAERARLQQRYKSLTRREREVMNHVVTGMPNKQIAVMLNITEKTVKFHRAHMTKKMLAGSVAALVQMALELGLRTNS